MRVLLNPDSLQDSAVGNLKFFATKLSPYSQELIAQREGHRRCAALSRSVQ